MGQAAADEGQAEERRDGVGDCDQEERAVVVAALGELGGGSLQQQPRHVLVDVCAQAER